MNFEAVERAYKNPEHAAIKSYAKAFAAPILSAIIHAVEGNIMSGVAVAQIIKSTSFASILVFFKSPLTASTPKTDVPFPSPLRILLSFIPVLVVIHSSFVSTIFSSSLFKFLFYQVSTHNTIFNNLQTLDKFCADSIRLFTNLLA